MMIMKSNNNLFLIVFCSVLAFFVANWFANSFATFLCSSANKKPLLTTIERGQL
jgi:hypothetical protein